MHRDLDAYTPQDHVGGNPLDVHLFHLNIAGLSLSMSFMDEIRKIPPVTRFLCASSLAVSVPTMLSIVSPYKLLFVKELVTKQWEVRVDCSLQVITIEPLLLDLESVHKLLPWRCAHMLSKHFDELLLTLSPY